MGDIRIGTSGWSYPGGAGTWNGVFYPARRGRGFDELAYYAERFDTVEVNSTFYHPPSPDAAASWVRRTPPRFTFSVKLHQSFTHRRMVERQTGRPHSGITPREVDEFKAGLDPIAASGRLGALLMQFPPSVQCDEESLDYLGWLLEAFADYTSAVELRHRTWSNRATETTALLAAHGAAWVQIDEPKFRHSIRQDFQPNVNTLHYVRFHGRNAATWWDHGHAEDRYDYLYTTAELEPFATRTRAASRLVRTLYLYFNNHFAAKAAANAEMLKHRLGIPATGGYPDAFFARYPELRAIVPSSAPLLSPPAGE